MPAVSGTVKDANGNFARRLVRAHRRDTGALVGETLSNPSTGAWSVTTADYSKHYAVAHDSDAWITYLPFNGDNGSTSFPEWGGKTVTAYGNAQISTEQSVFGGSSLKLDGSGDYLALPDSTDLEPEAGDFTLECLVRLTGYSASYGGAYAAVLIGKDQEGARGYNWRITGTASSFTGMTFSTAGSELSVSYAFSLNTWYHLAVCKSGTSLRFFVTGVQVGATQTHDTAIPNVSTLTSIGAITYSGYQYYLNGYIDDLRVSKGVARYIANFTPPTAPHGDALALIGNAMVFDFLTPV